MKEIKTNSYLKKEAQLDLPGDPGLPPGVNDRMIDERFDGGDSFSQDHKDNKGEIEIGTNWAEINSEMASLGYDTTGVPTEGQGVVNLQYLYDYTINDGNIEVSNIRAIEQQPLDALYTAYFEDEIKQHETEMISEF
jgi:hypothetical protein